MKLTGEQRIAVPRQQVWDALNDPEVLKQCIPGCQSLERESDGRMTATAAIKVGPIGARFTGAVTLSDLDPPNGYTITGEGAGGAAGFAKGSARVRLTEESGTTLLSYDVDAHVGGRLAQLGGPVIDATAKQLARAFFKRFGEIVAEPAESNSAEAAPIAAQASEHQPEAARTPRSQGRFLLWILAVIVAALVGFLVGRAQAGAPISSAAVPSGQREQP